MFHIYSYDYNGVPHLSLADTFDAAMHDADYLYQFPSCVCVHVYFEKKLVFCLPGRRS